MADAASIALSALLRKAQTDGNVDFLREGVQVRAHAWHALCRSHPKPTEQEVQAMEQRRWRTDEDILRDVRDTLEWDARIDAANVRVTVENGLVTLSGRVGLYAEKYIASEDTWRIKGVREVVNDLEVSPRAMRSDREIVEDITRIFRWDGRVNERSIVVQVARGVVRLTGTVRSAYEKRAAEEDIWHVPGVVELEDELEVSPLRPRRDAEIAADVRAAIARDARISDSRDVRVSCEEGVVSLQGRVETPEERRACEEDARFTAGVLSVVNHLELV